MSEYLTHEFTYRNSYYLNDEFGFSLNINKLLKQYNQYFSIDS